MIRRLPTPHLVPHVLSFIVPLLLLPTFAEGASGVSAEVAPDHLIGARAAREGSPIVEQRHTVSLERLENQPPPEAISRFNEAWAAFREGKLDKAIGKLESATRKHPQFAEAHNNLGFLYWQRGNRKKSLKAFEKAVQLDPTWVAALVNLAIVYYTNGDPASGLDAARRAIELQPQSARAHYTAGLILLLLDDGGKEALAHFDSAVEAFPQARLMAAYTMLRLDRPDQAEQALTQYLQDAPVF